MTSFLIRNFGCRVNQAEAFNWAAEFQSHGLKLENDPGRSDLVVVNSCTLTGRADRDVRKFINQVRRANPSARLILTGCYVERAREEFGNIPQVWLVFPNAEKEALASRVLSHLRPEKSGQILPYKSRALLKVQDGCDFRCTYCIIPHVRGKSSSLDFREALARAGALSVQGYREIVLSGIHLCSYGIDLEPRSSLPELLLALEEVEGLKQVRLSSLDPRFLKPEWLRALGASSKVCPHFHLSLQHASRRILERMGRRIGSEDFRELLASLRARFPEASLGADIIVGFPGEEDEDFDALSRFLEESPLSYFHVFSYSPRSWTAAASLPQVGDRVKKERSKFLREMSRKKNGAFRKDFVGKVCPGIVISKKGNRTEVLTSNYIKVLAPPTPAPVRESVRVLITEAGSRETTGKVVS